MKKKKFNDVSFILAVFILTMILVSGIMATFITPYNPFQPDMLHRLQSPSIEHWFGTDVLGRDLFSRILFGSRSTIFLALLSSFLPLLLGTLIGTLAGYYGKRIDSFVVLLSNVFQGIPSTCFMIAIVGFLGPGLSSLLLGFLLTSWVGFSRIIRAEVLKMKEEAFVEGLICIGCSDFRIVFFHIIPNIFNSLLVLGTLRIGRSILSLAGLSFLGLGVQPPMPDWSVMVSDAILYYRSYPHLILIPGCSIFFLVYSINIIGETLGDFLDVRIDEVRKCRGL